MTNRPEPVLTATVQACHRTYFIDIENDSQGEPFLVINESRRVPDGKYDRHKIIVAAEHVTNFFLALKAILIRGGLMEMDPMDTANESVDITASKRISAGSQNERFKKIRHKYPNAYRSWTADDDQKLKDAFQSCKELDVLSEAFQRKPGAITARLRKLGLQD